MAGLLDGEKLLGAESLIVDLGRCLDEVLQVRARQKVAKVNELAVFLVLD